MFPPAKRTTFVAETTGRRSARGVSCILLIQPIVSRVYNAKQGWISGNGVPAVQHDLMQTMGNRIRASRKKLKLTQASFGETLGVTAQAVTQWETDKARPSRDKLLLMRSRHGISIDYILYGTELPEHSGNDTIGSLARQGAILPMYDVRDLAVHGIERAQPIGTVAVPFQQQPGTFVTTVPDSANSPELSKGDIVAWDQVITPSPGDLVLAVHGAPGKAVIGEFRIETTAAGTVSIVAPLNPRWPHVRSDIESFETLGVFVGSVRHGRRSA